MAKTQTKKTQTDDIIELTQETHARLVEELDNRKNILREEIAKEIAEARELGDLSENHPYAVAMEKREMNENRITELENMLKDAKVIKSKASTKIVAIGKIVELKNTDSGKSRKVELVGSEETGSADPSVGKVSIDSPIGKAIHNAAIGEVVDVELPKGVQQYKIVKFAA